MPSPRSGIVIVDDDEVVRELVIEAVAPLRRPTVGLSSGEALLEFLNTGLPELIIIDLMMPGMSGLDTIEALRSQPRQATVPIVVLTGLSSEEVAAAFSAGADDYVTKPFQRNELVARVKRQLTAHRRLDELNARERDLETVMDLVQRMGQPDNIRQVLLQMVTRVSEMCNADRVSLVLSQGANDIAFVVASSDDPDLKDLPIRLKDYPEISQCAEQQVPILLQDAPNDPLFRSRGGQRQPPFHSMALAPISNSETTTGVLFVRSRAKNALAPRQLSLLQTLGRAARIAIDNARLLSSLRAESQQSVEAKRQAERRMRVFQPYAEFFRTAAEGMVVIEPSGRILFANPRAREMAGGTARLEGANVADFLYPTEHGKAKRLAQAFRNNILPTGIDIKVRAAEGPRTLNVNSSATLRGSRRVLLTFRDATRERQTEQELTQTKMFLERVIDSSVDAIVSAGTDGRVLIFNRAAARIFGYEPSDVIQKMHVERLYPPEGARDVMRQIRGASNGGKDRLEDYQVNMMDSFGKLVPVRISAALIFERGKAVGSVGIFTDIRDELRMAADLREAQDELKEQEKNMAVAQLAGTAAHELNQPLTSIIAYSELLDRKMDPNSPLKECTSIIMSQAERMADIVRKIGQITRYETMSYVGKAQILDLDKAAKPISER